jgi:hypothetical protein
MPGASAPAAERGPLRLGIEHLYLDWRDVDLVGGGAIFRVDTTKAGKRHNADLQTRTAAALANPRDFGLGNGGVVSTIRTAGTSY